MRLETKLFMVVAILMVATVGAVQTVQVTPTVHINCATNTITVYIPNESISNLTFGAQVLLVNHNFTSVDFCNSPVNVSSISSSDLFSSPQKPVVPQNKTTVTLQPNQSVTNPVTNTTYLAAPQKTCDISANVIPSWLGSSLLSNTIAPCDVSVNVTQIPRLNYTNRTLYPGNTLSNTLIGLSIRSSWATNNSIITLPVGGSLPLPSGALVEAQSANTIAHNTSDLEAIDSAQLAGCPPNGFVTFHDSVTDHNQTFCDETPNGNVSILALGASLNLQNGSLTRNIGAACLAGIIDDNQSAGTWHSDYTTCESTANSTENGLRHANNLNYTNRTDLQGQINTQNAGLSFLGEVLAGVMIFGTICYGIYRLFRWLHRKRLKEAKGLNKK